jgi:hypothetical protein
MQSLRGCKVSGVKYAVTMERTYSTLRSSNNPANFAASSSQIILDEIKRTFPVLSEQNKHLYITRNTQEAAQVLMSMYNSLSDLNPPLADKTLYQNLLFTRLRRLLS